MSKPDYLDQLIDAASKAAGSDYKLAQLLGATRQTVSNWRHDKKSCPVGDQVLMAEIAGLKSEEWAARAIVAQYAGTEKGDKLYRALGKLLAVTGAVVASSGASAQAIYSLTPIANAVNHFIRCIERLTRPKTMPHAV